MNRKPAVEVCATLERRQAALVRSALAGAARCESASLAESDRLLRARTGLASVSVWTAQRCAFMSLHGARAAAAIARFRSDSEKSREQAAAHETRRRHWAALVRGLRRREARLLTRDLPCPD